MTEAFKKQYYFELTSDMLVRRSPDGGILVANPWAVADYDKDLLPYLTGDLAIPMTPDDLTVCAPCAVGDSNTMVAEQLPIAKRFVDLRLLGEFPATELISDIVQARSLDQALELSFTLSDRTGAGAAIEQGNSGAASRTSPQVLSTAAFWQTPTIGGYFFQFRGPDYQGMIPCAPESPKHYHIELWKQVQWKPNQSLMNLHIALWKAAPGRYCFALANSQGWPSCIKICNPTWNDIYKPVLSALLSIGIAYLFAVTLASLVATFLYGSIAVLAI
jgi:hypothetical protein